MADPAVYRTIGSSHTAIVIADNGKTVQFIPMSTLLVSKQDAREFHHEWEPMPLYPVQRAAVLYLGATQYREMSPKAREHLEAIAGNQKLAFDEARIIPQPANKESSMATAKTAPAKQPATSKLASSAPAKTKVAGKTDQPVKAAAKAAPAKTAAAPVAAKKGAVKNGMDTVVSQAAKKGAAPAKQPAPAAKGAAVPRVSPNADQKLRVAEADKPRRGVTQEFVNEALKLKTFTRQQLLDVMVKKGHEEKPARIKIADCVYFEVFEAV